MSCHRYAPKRWICPEVREASWHPHRSGQASCQIFWNSDGQAVGIVADSPTCHSKTFLKPRPKPMKMNDMAIATRQLQQS